LHEVTETAQPANPPKDERASLEELGEAEQDASDPTHEKEISPK